MIEASAATAHDESQVAQQATVQHERRARFLRMSPGLAAGWLVFTIGLAWFIYAGSVRVGAGHWLGQRLRVRVIWSRFLDFLADHGANSLMVGLVVFIAAITLLGSLALLWKVLGLREDDFEPPVRPDVS